MARGLPDIASRGLDDACFGAVHFVLEFLGTPVAVCRYWVGERRQPGGLDARKGHLSGR